jgi:hypothetical protein
LALDVQNTVNAVAILTDYQDVVYSLKELNGQHKVGKHPAARLFLDKVHDLIGTPSDERLTPSAYGECEAACLEIVAKAKA